MKTALILTIRSIRVLYFIGSHIGVWNTDFRLRLPPPTTLFQSFVGQCTLLSELRRQKKAEVKGKEKGESKKVKVGKEEPASVALFHSFSLLNPTNTSGFGRAMKDKVAEVYPVE